MNVWTENIDGFRLTPSPLVTYPNNFKQIQIQVLKQALKYALHTGCTCVQVKLALQQPITINAYYTS